MSNESAVASAFAAADKRLKDMSALCQVFSGQIDRQRRELAEIKAAIASAGKPEEQRHAVPGEIAPDMLG
jgi:hypothetical protein